MVTMTAFGHGSASFRGSSPFTANIVATNADTEYSYALPDNTTVFTIKSRNKGRLKIAYISGQSGTNFLTISPGSSYTKEGTVLTGITVYIQSSKPNDVIEIDGISG